MSRRFFLLVTIAVFLLMTMFSSHDIGTQAAPPERHDLLIGFHGPPDPELVRGLGGDIYREFNIINVIAARLPEAGRKALAEHTSIRFIEFDTPVYALEQSVPWGIDRVFEDETEPFPTWWTSTGSPVAVAVLDTGIDKFHEDLAANVVGGINTVDDTNWWDDVHTHGTHVAGTIAAINNDVGVVGVAPGAQLFAVKVLEDEGSGTASSVAAGIDWAVTQNIPIINMSLGAKDFSQTLQEACDAAYSAGHLILASAGNAGEESIEDNVRYPARFNSVIAVGASDPDDNRAQFASSWSSTGPAVELIAPGLSIMSTLPGDSYGTKSGTSMASPHVAGVAALVWATDPALSNVGLRSVLNDSAVDLGLHDWEQGNGLVRADHAVAAVAPDTSVSITTHPLDFGTLRAGNSTSLNQTPLVEIQGPNIAELAISVSPIGNSPTPWRWGDGIQPDTVKLSLRLIEGPEGLVYPLEVVIDDAGEFMFFSGESIPEGTYVADATLSAGPQETATLNQSMWAVITYSVVVD